MYRISQLIWLAFASPALIAPVIAASGEQASDAAACFRAIDREPALKGVNAKFSRERATSAQLADASVATEDEAEALRLLARKTRDCREKELAAVENRDPLLAPAYRILYYQREQVLDYLQQQAISFGTANRLNGEARGSFDARQQSYTIASPARQAEFAELWDEELQRGHSNPPQPAGLACTWEALNILCR
jgi:hypothetical protein